MLDDIRCLLRLILVFDELGVVRGTVLPNLALCLGGNKLLAAREFLSLTALIVIPAIELIAGISFCRRALCYAGVRPERLTLRRNRSAANSLVVNGDSVLLLPDGIEGHIAIAHREAVIIGTALRVRILWIGRIFFSIPTEERISRPRRRGREVNLDGSALRIALLHRNVSVTAIRMVGNLMRFVRDDDAVDIPADLPIVVVARLDYVPFDMHGRGIVFKVRPVLTIIGFDLLLDLGIRWLLGQVCSHEFRIVVNRHRLLQFSLKLSAIICRKISAVVARRLEGLLPIDANVEIRGEKVSVTRFAVKPDSIQRHIARKLGVMTGVIRIRRIYGIDVAVALLRRRPADESRIAVRETELAGIRRREGGFGVLASLSRSGPAVRIERDGESLLPHRV